MAFNIPEVSYTPGCSAFIPNHVDIYWGKPEKGETPEQEKTRKQEAFLRQRESNIRFGVVFVNKHLQGEDREKPFPFQKLVDMLGTQRNRLAVEQQTERLKTLEEVAFYLVQTTF